MKVQATKTTEYEIRCARQTEDDSSDGTGAGWYAWVGPSGDQSDFAVGPFKTAAIAREEAVGKLVRMGYAVEKA